MQCPKCQTENGEGASFCKDVDRGSVNIRVGFAPFKPVEFVIIKIQQILAKLRCKEESMAQFSVNTHRFDPYKNFKFRVKWDGQYVAGVSKISALKWTSEVVEHREGGDPSIVRKSPGQSKYEPITLERGVTHDPEFEKWVNKVWNFGSGLGMETSLKDFRKDIILEVYNEAGQLVIAYKIYRCWPSEYQALPELDASGNAVSIQILKLENEGWERDYEVGEPSEPSFTEPAG